ncbi:hypothetical protein FB451DRAFT_1391440 [Mycena latifolia]|nr:hypothetical protein FB451DRAFT_1391440 [Mycena latifolia]
MGGVVHAQVVVVPVPLSFEAYTANDGGGASAQYNNVVTDICRTTNATVRSIKPEAVQFAARFYGSSDCTDYSVPFGIQYNKVTNTERDVNSIEFVTTIPPNLRMALPLSFTAYTANNGGGASAQYSNVVTGKCYKTIARVRSIKAEPVKLDAIFFRSSDCTHIVGDGLIEVPREIAYNQVTNTKADAGSVLITMRDELIIDPGF